MKPLKVKILGSGGAAKKHKAAFDELPDLYEVTDGDADITDICTPPNMHFPQAYEALLNGHVIVEKPVAGSLKAVDALAAAERTTGNFVCPVFQYRFSNHEATPRKIEQVWQRNALYWAGWRSNWNAALGGCLTSHGIHVIDLMLAKYGKPDEVMATMALGGVERTAAIALRWGDDIGHIRIHISEHSVPSGFNLGDSHKGYVEQFRLLHEALTNETPLPVTLREARDSLEILTACYASAFKGKPVKLPLKPAHSFYKGWTKRLAQHQQRTESSPIISV